MESKLLVGGKNIIDHTNEQQKMLEVKRQEIAEQVCVFAEYAGWLQIVIVVFPRMLPVVQREGDAAADDGPGR